MAQQGEPDYYDADNDMHPGYSSTSHYAPYRGIESAARDPNNGSSAHAQGQLPPAAGIGELVPYDEEKAYSEWQRGEAERRQRYEDAHRIPVRRHYDDDDDYKQPERQRHEVRRDSYARDHTSSHKDGQLAGTLLGGSAGALLGRELVQGPLGTIGGAVVGALAGRSIEGYDDKKRREKDDERRRIRREYDSQSYDPRGSSRSSNFYDSHYASPATTVHDGRYPSTIPRDVRQSRQHPSRRQRRRPSTSSDSYTSDD